MSKNSAAVKRGRLAVVTKVLKKNYINAFLIVYHGIIYSIQNSKKLNLLMV